MNIKDFLNNVYNNQDAELSKEDSSELMTDSSTISIQGTMAEPGNGSNSVPSSPTERLIPSKENVNQVSPFEPSTCFDTIRQNAAVGQQISLNGVLTEVGDDYLVISTGTEYIFISKAIHKNNAFERFLYNLFQSGEFQNEDEDTDLQANGYICRLTSKGGVIYDYSSKRQIPFQFFYNKHISENQLHLNDKVIFYLYPNKRAIKKTDRDNPQGICPVNINDACEICSNCLKSEASQFLLYAGKFIFERLFQEFPHHQKVKSLKRTVESNKSLFSVNSFYSIKRKADSLIELGLYEKAEKLYLAQMSNRESDGSKIQDVLTELFSLYMTMYDNADENKKDIIKDKILQLIDNNDILLSGKNFGYRKHLLKKIRRLDLLENYIDKIYNSLDSNKLKAASLKHKAELYADNNRDEYIRILSESLAHNPWDNTPEERLNTVLGYTNDDDKTTFVTLSSDDDSIAKDSFLSSLFFNYVEADPQESLETALVNKKNHENLLDCSKVNTLDYNNNSEKVIHCYKSIKANLPGKIIASYCSSKALVLAKENGELQSIRFLLSKALSYVSGFGFFVRRTLYIYLLCHLYENGEQLYANIPQPSKILDFETILTKLVQKRYDWLDIISLVMLANTSVCNKIRSWFLSNALLCEKCKLLFIERYSSVLNFNNNDYEVVWNHHLDLYRTKLYDNEHRIRSIQDISGSTDIEECKYSLEYISNLSDDEKSKVEQIFKLLDATKKMLLTKDVSSKQREAMRIVGLGNELARDILMKPTGFSCSLIHIIKLLSKFIYDNYHQIRLSFNNKISIKSLTTNTPIINRNSSRVTLEVYNEEGGLPIRDVRLSVSRRGDEDKFLFECNRDTQIDSGDSWECPCELRINPNDITNKYIEIDVTLSFNADSDAKNHTYKHWLKINLFPIEEFVRIENPFNPTGGKPLRIENKDMFFGRTNLLAELEYAFRKEDSYRHFIIYGQKRCGKSSFLNMLKYKLSDCNDLLIIQFELPSDIRDEYDFYRIIINSITKELTDDPNQKVDLDELTDIRKKSTSVDFFRDHIQRLKVHEKWGDKRLLLMIDEFTSIYDGIKSGRITETLLKDWKYIAEDSAIQFGAVLVGHDITPSFLAEDYNKNATAILEQRRLTYLSGDEANRLIIYPIMDGNNSRYVKKAVVRIMEYTGKNPYYIQIFCHVLIDYINRTHSNRITMTDVEAVAKMLICGTEDGGLYFSSIGSFDNLLSNGLHSKWNKYSDDDVESVLRVIAEESNKSNGLCSRDTIHLSQIEDKVDKILEDLCKRDVIERKSIDGNSYYKICVLLFKEWLINHPE